VVQIRFSFVVCVLAVLCPATVLAQTPPREFFVVCGSQPNQGTVYFSGVMQGPATAFQGFRSGFANYLSQTYGYQGVVGCVPGNNAANAQTAINQRAAALRNAKKNVVQTGWTVPAAMAAAPAVVPSLPAAKQAMAALGGGAAAQPQPPPSAAGSSGNAGGGNSQLSSILDAVLAAGGGGSSARGAAAAPASGGTSGSNQQGATQVASTTTPSPGTNPSGAASQDAAEQGAPQVLGSAQAQNTKLIVYGCARQDTQVACLTDLVNQNRQNTLVQAARIWKDAFIVDDRGDRHPRSGGFFMNIDGDQRPQLDISYGKSAQFVLTFDDVQTKVQKVALRSASGGLDIEDISLMTPEEAQKQ